jgi:hypothetical protein
MVRTVDKIKDTKSQEKTIQIWLAETETQRQIRAFQFNGICILIVVVFSV